MTSPRPRLVCPLSLSCMQTISDLSPVIFEEFILSILHAITCFAFLLVSLDRTVLSLYSIVLIPAFPFLSPSVNSASLLPSLNYYLHYIFCINCLPTVSPSLIITLPFTCFFVFFSFSGLLMRNNF